ncbi:pentapeptide repeat-containing protein, partial [Paraburkholderia sediminicola]|uniref:pentapeptide repeat-containing protein n=1 Tax=Paraburkholderia sediminicola TaxID=458836 RepID=UPI0038BD203A
EANLTAARFDRCYFTHFSFESSMLENAQFSDCYMYYVAFGYADAREARFSRINLVMPEGVALPPERARGAIGHWMLFTETILHNAVFEWCDLEDTHFSPFRGNKVTFDACHLYAASTPYRLAVITTEMRLGPWYPLAKAYERRNPGKQLLAPVPRPLAQIDFPGQTKAARAIPCDLGAAGP